jgi:hypothetical protein
MIQLKDLGYLLESFLELLDLLEVIAKLDDRRRLEHPLLVDHKLAVLERVDVAFDE